ncbi:LytTR family DNA-binding domain-containing protein [Clostridium sp. CX1]|uniref:LytR/AlgR family response regulator transcription factor n=1 Tax=Clostridium sp. CX1 TaxID=2978346 RepID=UPI0021BE767F|nr:LytTR family DNA-binding domain-containing protein [Clostridium sp. CX1]MCT8976334.1 LytTR family DNA-binding domain-containing protein [Clostridium sp. CX1]
MVNKLRVIIVEDELPAAEELKFIISQYDFIHVEGVAHDGQKGLELIKEKKPNAVFLDINMPLQNGIKLAEEIKRFDNSIEVIFVTAYEEHAIKAFEVDALDYILKPFDDKRIAVTIDRLISKLNVKKVDQDNIPNIINEIINKIDRVEKLVKKIPCERKGKIILVDVKDIYFCFIEDEKTYIKTKAEQYLVGYTLHQIEEKTNFFRAHRSYLVNMDNIREMYSWFNGTYKLVMNDNEKSEVPISRNNVKKLKELLEI